MESMLNIQAPHFPFFTLSTNNKLFEANKFYVFSKGSCLQVTSCWWASWGPWTGHVTPGKCGTQRRTRSEHSRQSYTYRQNNCNGIRSRCSGSFTSEVRNMCKSYDLIGDINNYTM